MQRRSEETRTRILKAAQKMFAGQGYDATGVAEICLAANVSKGAFYHHFPTKQAVYLDLLQDWLLGLDQHLEHIRSETGEIPKALLNMSGMLAEVFQAARGQLPIFLEFWTQSSRDPEIWQATIAPYHRYVDLFSSLVRQGIAEGSFREVDPETTSRLVVALAVGILFQGLLDPNGANWEQTTRQGMRYLLEGLSKEAR